VILDTLFGASQLLFDPVTLTIMVIGVLAGIIVGALPGVGTSLGMAIILPLTLPMSGVNALVLLVGVYSGSMYGGSIAAILINAPGTAGSAATTLDGYPLSRSGRAMNALSMSVVASVIGGSISLIVLLLISPAIIELVLWFQSPEYFVVAVLGLSLIVVVARGSVLKGVISGCMGLLIGTVGLAPTVPHERFTFGNLALFDGINFIAVLIALFAVAEMIKLASESGGISKTDVEIDGSIRDGINEVLRRPYLTVKSALIGMGVGAIPGGGSSVANFLAYGEAARSSKDPDSFGSGNPEGVISAEASNNGTIGGSIIPTIAFGIPGSGATAVLLGGLIMHGLRPGPELFTAEAATTYAMLLSILIGNIIILIVGLGLITRAGVVTRIDTTTIIPVVIVLSVLGSLTLRNNWIDVATLVVLGLIGYVMVRQNYSVIAMVLGVILGPIAEENLHRSLQISDGSFIIFLERPISLVLLLATVFILFGPMLKRVFRSWRNR